MTRKISVPLKLPPEQLAVLHCIILIGYALLEREVGWDSTVTRTTSEIGSNALMAISRAACKAGVNFDPYVENARSMINDARWGPAKFPAEQAI